jgi:ACS family tartrate transporter-like MFS transporter
MTSTNPSARSALDRARTKAYWRLLPLLFLCYVIAYVDRVNVSLAKLTMARDMPAFDNAVIGFGAGVFFWGYFLLEIPGSILVEKWSARKWICRIMLTWGVLAALTAVVKTPMQFYVVRFCLGLAEAGFFPGVIVYLTHWFSARDRTRALAFFFVGTPVAQIISPKISNAILKIGSDEVINGTTVHHPQWLGLQGWQWLYMLWGIPAIVLGVMVLVGLKDRPRDAHWLTTEEREALEAKIAEDKAAARKQRITLLQAFAHPKVLLIAFAYFCSVTGSYGVEFFLPSILQQWYKLNLNAITWLVILPPLTSLAGQLFIGWNSDRLQDRCLHAVVPIAMSAAMLAVVPFTQGHLALTVLCFMIAAGGFKAYLPAMWAMPSLILTDVAAAGSIGFINSVGNLGGFFGPAVLGKVQTVTGSFVGGLYYLAASATVSAIVLLALGVGRNRRAAADVPAPAEPAAKR